MSLEEWLKIIGYISTGILVAVTIYTTMNKIKRDQTIEQSESKRDGLNERNEK